MEPVPIGRKIAHTRAQQYRTGTGVAEAAEISAETLSRIEHGKVSPRLATVGKIARALDLSLEELIEGTDLAEDSIPKAWAPKVSA